ncbi:MAG: substrate-binding domain-containing protein [Propioniciclava sp.]
MSRNRFTTGAAVAALLTTLSLAGCGGGASPSGAASGGAGGNLKIGAIYLDTQGFYAGVKKGVELGAEEAGRTVTFVETNAAADAAKESAFIDTLISSQVDAILLSAVSADASVPALRNASEAGIPVVCYNTCIKDDEAPNYVQAYAYGDPVDFGYATGEAAADFLDSEGKDSARIGVLNCEFVEVCVHRREGFEKALTERDIDYEIVANQEATDPNESIGIAENMLTANPDIDLFYGESGGATLGGVKAVENKGKVGEVHVFGSDMTTELAEALESHDVLKASIDVSGIAVGKAAIGAAIAVIDGEQVEFTMPVPIDVYSTPEQGADWLETHPDGIP